jgi:hypothetical protein
MKKAIWLLTTALILGSCSTMGPFAPPRDGNASLVYCSFRFADRQTEVTGLVIRSADNHKAPSITMRNIGDGVFVADGMAPGNYYLETMILTFPDTHDLGQSRLDLGSRDNHDWDFEIAEKTILNIGTCECTVRRKAFLIGSVIVSKGPHRDDIDVEALKLLMAKAAGTYWEEPLTSYYQQKYGSAQQAGTQIN